MGFGLLNFVILFAIVWHKKFCDAATPNLTLTGKSELIVGENLTLTCAVNQDVDLLSVSFFREIIETIWISNPLPTPCTFYNLIPDDNSTYSTTCDPSKRNFTMTKYNLDTSDDNTVWFCQMKSVPGGNGTCVGTNNSCTSGNVTIHVSVKPSSSAPSSTTTTTTITVTSSSLSSTSMSSTTSSTTTDNTSTKPTTNGSTASATSSTFISTSPTTVLPHNDTNNISTSRNPTITGSAVSATSNTSASTSSTAVSPANNTSNASTSANPTTAEPTAITKTSTGNNWTKSNISDTDIKVIVPAVVVPCGLLIIGAIVLVIFCVRRKAGNNVRESPDGMAIQDKGNNIDGWKQSLGHGKATDNLGTVYTTPDGFIIYPGPAAVSTARSYKDKKYHGVRDQYSRPDPRTHHHQADYIPSTYTSARGYTHRGKKHHVVTDQYSRPYPGNYGNQTAYFPSTYKSARTYAQKGKTYEGHQPVSNLMANSRLAYDQPASNPMANSRLAYGQTAYYPQTGYYGESGQDVYYSGGGQQSYGQRSRSHHDHNGRKQQRDYYSQYEMADYGGSGAGYRHTKQDTAFYY